MAETFEDQAAAVRRVLKGEKPAKADRKHLECAAKNLAAFGAFRQKIVDLAENEELDAQADEIAVEVLKLLHIPIPQ